MKSFFLKPACIAATLITSALTVQAQQTYIDVNVGYGFGTNASTQIFSNSTYYNNSIDQVTRNTQEMVSLSLGKGMNFGLSAGYMFNKNIGVDLGLNYHLGGVTKSTHERSYIYEDWNNGGTISETGKGEMEISSNMFQITPSLVIASGGEKVSVYSKLGVIMGFGSIDFKSMDESINPYSIYTSETQQKFNGGMAFGFSGGVGSNFFLSEKLAIFGEVNYTGLSYAPTKGEMTKYVENGEDLLHQLSTHEKEVKFVTKTTHEYNFANPYNEDEPAEALKIAFPYSSIGLKVGVRFNL